MIQRAHRAIHGWLLLLPAMALLALFTHWPALATFIDSFWSTPRPRRPAAFVGLDQYRAMLADPVFWQSVVNNLWFALGTVPVSIALALLMAVWVNDRIAGRALVRMAYFTPTILGAGRKGAAAIKASALPAGRVGHSTMNTFPSSTTVR